MTWCGADDVLELLLASHRGEHGWASENALSVAASHGHSKALSLLVGAGVDPDTAAPPEVGGLTALGSSVHVGNVEAVAGLLRDGAHPNLRFGPL